MEKEFYIASILNSTNGIEKAVPNDSLFDRIKDKINEEYTVSTRTKWLVAASIAVLFSLNIGVISAFNKKAQKSKDNLHLISTFDNQLYHNNEQN